MQSGLSGATTRAAAVTLLRQMAPASVVIDVEPFIAYWDSDEATLANGVETFLADIAGLSSLSAVCFSTNSRRSLRVSQAVPGLQVYYVSQAWKPLRIAMYGGLPRPGVVIGDQFATDGLLAWRLGFAFIHYRPRLAKTPLGPRLMHLAGHVVRATMFTSSKR